MRIRFVNPNTTAAMTETVRAAAASAAPPQVTVEAVTSRRGPAAIEGPEDGEAAVPGLLEAIRAGLDAGADAFVIACFDDTGLERARALAMPRPVIGIGQAAFHAAMLLGGRFSVVTTLAVSVPVIERNLARYGIAGACARVRASGVPVLDLEHDRERATEKVSAEIGRAAAEDDVDAIVLGCAGMAPLVAPMAARHGVAVVDGVIAATGLAAALVGARRAMALEDDRARDGAFAPSEAGVAPARVLLLSERGLFARAFGKLLAALRPGIDVVEAGAASPAPSSAGVDLVLLDAAGLDAAALAERVAALLGTDGSRGSAGDEARARAAPDGAVATSAVPSRLAVVLDEADAALADAALAAGAAGVLIKAAPPGTVADALDALLAGARVRPAPSLRLEPQALPQALRERLSARRQKLLRRLLGGAPIGAIARELGMTEAKVVAESRVVMDIVRGGADER